MKCLYLHGLDSQPMKEKDDVLRTYFENVVSPKLNYRRENIFDSLCDLVALKQIEIIVGSSFGGLMSFFLSQKYSLSAILFNPALAYYDDNPSIINDFQRLPMKKVFVAIGEEDEVVKPQSTIDFLERNEFSAEQIHIEVIEKLGHRIPVDIFENTIIRALNMFEGSHTQV